MTFFNVTNVDRLFSGNVTTAHANATHGVFLPAGKVEYMGLDEVEFRPTQLVEYALAATSFTQPAGSTLVPFNGLNQVLAPVVIILPKLDVLETEDIKVDISQLECKDISIGSVGMSALRRSSTLVEFDLSLVDLNVACQSKWSYVVWGGFLSGDGDAVVSFTNADGASSLQAKISFTAAADSGAPTSAEVSQCTPELRLDMSLSGSFIAGTLNLFRGALESEIETQLTKLICEELTKMGPTLFTDLLSKVSGALGPYTPCSQGQKQVLVTGDTNITQCTPSEILQVADPLVLEKELEPRFAGHELLSFTHPVFSTLTAEVQKQLGGRVNDTQANDSSRVDLGINPLVRQFADQGVLSLDLDMPVLQGSDEQFATQVTLKKVHVGGLDTFTRFDMLAPLSNVTLGLGFDLRELSGTVEMEIAMEPRGLPLKANSLQSLGEDACNANNRCESCQGDCNSDADCANGLKCFQRSVSETVPGCAVGGAGDIIGYDYCFEAIPVTVTIGSSDDTEKCVDSDPVLCNTDAGNKGKRLNEDWPDADDSFEITVKLGKVCAKRADQSGQWGMNLQLSCFKDAAKDPLSELEIKSLKVNNTFNVSIILSRLAFDAASLLAMDKERLLDLRIGQLVAAPVGCAATAALVANFTKLGLSLGDLSQPIVQGLLGDGVEALVNGLIAATFTMYKQPALTALPNAASLTGVGLLNDFINKAISNESSKCLAPAPLPSSPDYMNLNNSTLFSKVSSMIDSALDPSGSGSSTVVAAKVNQLINDATNGTVGVKQLLDLSHDLSKYGSVSLKATDLKVKGLDTFSELDVNKVTSNYSTKFAAVLGKGALGNPLRVQVSLEMTAAGGSLGKKRDEFTMSLSLSSFEFLLDLMAMVDKNRLNALRLEQLLTPECMVATFRTGGMGFKDIALALHGLRFGLNCTSCDSPRLRQLSQRWNEEESMQLNNFTAFLNAAFANMSSYLEGPNFQNVTDGYILSAPVTCARQLPPLAWAPAVSASENSKGDMPAVTTEETALAGEEPLPKQASSDLVTAMLGESLQTWWKSVAPLPTNSTGVLAIPSPIMRPYALDSLNEVLAPVVLTVAKLPSIKQGPVEVAIDQLECKHVGLGSVATSTERRSARLVELAVVLQGVSVSCRAHWSYSLLNGTIQGSGFASLAVVGKGSSLQAKVDLDSMVDSGYPTSASVSQCEPRLDLNVSFSGGVQADVLNLVMGLVQDGLSSQVSSLLCAELIKMAPSALTDMLVDFGAQFGPHLPCAIGQTQTIVRGGTSYIQCISQPDLDLQVIEPLSVEKSVVPKLAGRDIFSFKQPLIMSLTESLQGQIGGAVGETLPDGSIRTELGINTAIRKLMKNKNELALGMTIPILEGGEDELMAQVAITNVAIAGLDSFTRFDMLAPLSNWTLGYGFDLRKLAATVQVHLAMHPKKMPPMLSEDPTLPQIVRDALKNLTVSDLAIDTSFNVSFGLEGLAFSAAQLLALDKGLVEQLRVGQLVAAPLGCALKAAAVANFTEISLAIADLAEPRVQGLIGAGVDSLVNSLIEGIFTTYKSPALAALPNLVGAKGMSLINEFTNSTIASESSKCLAPAPLPSVPDYYDFKSSQLFSNVSSLVNQLLDPSGDGASVGISKINTLIGDATKNANSDGMPGNVEVGELIAMESDLAGYGNVSIKLSDLKISGLDTFSELFINKPTSSYSTASTLALGRGGDATGLRFELTAMLEAQGGSLGNKQDHFTLSLGLSDFRILLEILAKIDQARVEALRLEQLLTPDCVLATFREEGLGLRDFLLSFDGLRLGVNCHSCASSLLQELSQQWNEQDSTVLQSFTIAANNFLTNASSFLKGDSFQKWVDKYIRRAPAACVKQNGPLEWAPAEEQTGPVPIGPAPIVVVTPPTVPEKKAFQGLESILPSGYTTILASALQGWWGANSTAVRVDSGNKSKTPVVHFIALNEVLAPVVLKIPEIPTIKMDPLEMNITQLECKQFGIGSINVASVRKSFRLVEFDVALDGIRGSCGAQWTYKLFDNAVAGSGGVSIGLSGTQNNIQGKIAFRSVTDDGQPANLSVPQCDLQLDLDISFSGGVETGILNRITDLFQRAFLNQIKDILCGELSNRGAPLLTDMLLKLGDQLGPYLPCVQGQNETVVRNGISHTQCARNFMVPEYIDPLSAEQSLESDLLSLEGRRLLNLTGRRFLNLTHPSISQATSLAQANLGAEVKDGDSMDLGINTIMRKAMGGKDSLSLEMAIPLLKGTEEQYNAQLAITKVGVGGLDSFTRFDMIQPLSKWTIGYGFDLSRLDASVQMQLAMRDPKLPQNLSMQGLDINTTFNVSFGIRGLALDAAQVLALDIAHAEQLSVGQLLAAPLGCALKAAVAANFTKLKVGLEDVVLPKVQGLIGMGVDSAVNGLVETSFSLYRLPALTALPNLMKLKGVAAVNDFITDTIATEGSMCADPAPLSSQPDYFCFDNSTIMSQVSALVNKQLDPKGDGQSVRVERVNELVADMTKGLNPEGVPGSIVLDDVVAVRKSMGELGNVIFNVTDLKIAGLNTFTELLLNKPTSNYSTKFALAMGSSGAADANALRVQMAVALALHGGSAGNIDDKFTLSSSLSSIQFLLEVKAMIDQARIKSLRMEQVLSPDCLLATFREGGLSLKNFTLALAGFRLGLNCSSCTSSYLKELDAAWNEQESDDLQSLTRFTNQFFANLSTWMQSPRVQNIVDRRINTATVTCAAKKPPLLWESNSTPAASQDPGDAPGLELTSSTGLFVGISLLGVLMCCLCSAFQARFLRVAADATDSGTEAKGQDSVMQKTASSEDSSTVQIADPVEEDNTKAVVAGREAMVCSNQIPCFCRIVIVFVWLVVLALFFAGHVLLAISIDVRMQFLTLDLSFEGLEKLNILRAIREMINGKVYFLATIIISVSLVWPYVRTLGMLTLFCVPSGCVSPQKRGKLLVWLDFLAKWSMFDIYTLIVFVLALNLNITSPKRLSILPAGLYHLELIMSPQNGLYANLLAQVVSQLVSHAQIYYHRKIVESTTPALCISAAPREEATPTRSSTILLGRLGGRSMSSDTIKSAGASPKDGPSPRLLPDLGSPVPEKAASEQSIVMDIGFAMGLESRDEGPLCSSGERDRGTTILISDCTETLGSPVAEKAASDCSIVMDIESDMGLDSTDEGVRSTTVLISDQAGLPRARADTEGSDISIEVDLGCEGSNLGCAHIEPATTHFQSVCSYSCAVLALRKRGWLLSWAVRICVPAMLLVGTLLLGFGMVLPTMSVKTNGMVGILLDFGETDGRTVTQSVLDMTEVMARQVKTNFINECGIWSLTVIFLVCTFITPAVQAVVWAIMWAAPLSLDRLKGLIVLSEVLSAWNFFEVFMIAILIAVMQLERLAFGLLETMRQGIGDSTYVLINQIVEAMKEIGLISSSDQAIFELTPDLHAGAYVLLMSAALLACAGLIINGQAAAYARSRV